MPYLWNEKRFHKNFNRFDFHVDRYRTGEILAKIWDIFLAVLKGLTHLLIFRTLQNRQIPYRDRSRCEQERTLSLSIPEWYGLFIFSQCTVHLTFFLSIFFLKIQLRVSVLLSLKRNNFEICQTKLAGNCKSLKTRQKH